MASPGSSIRSAARATSSAYKRLPIRWRLAGGSAALTLVILLGFATIVGVLTTRRIQSDFNQQVADAADQLRQADRRSTWSSPRTAAASCATTGRTSRPTPAPQHAVIRVVTGDNDGRSTSSPNAPYLSPAARRPRSSSPATGSSRAAVRVDQPLRRHSLRPVRAPALRRPGDREPRAASSSASACSAAPRSRCSPASRPRAARWRPIAELTETARTIERTRDPSRRIPLPGGRGRGRRARAHARGDAPRARPVARRDRGDAGAPARVRRRRLARAAHAADLRARQPRAARGGARGRAARGRRLRPALLAADAPARRRPAAARARRRGPHHAATSRSTSPAWSPRPRASSSRSPTATTSPSTPRRARRSPARATSSTGSRSTCSRTRCATPIRAPRSRRRSSASTARSCCRSRTTARASRRSSTTRSSSASSAAPATASGSSGLGLAIVRAVAESHHGNVTLEDPLDGRGARFVVRFPAQTQA